MNSIRNSSGFLMVFHIHFLLLPFFNHVWVQKEGGENEGKLKRTNKLVPVSPIPSLSFSQQTLFQTTPKIRMQEML